NPFSSRRTLREDVSVPGSGSGWIVRRGSAAVDPLAGGGVQRLPDAALEPGGQLEPPELAANRAQEGPLEPELGRAHGADLEMPLDLRHVVGGQLAVHPVVEPGEHLRAGPVVDVAQAVSPRTTGGRSSGACPWAAQVPPDPGG